MRHGPASLVFIAAALLLPPGPAHAADPTIADCLAASEASLNLDNQHKVRAERSQLLICAAANCPVEIRQECISRVDEVNKQIPTIIFAAKDGSGADLTAVTVAMDGEILAEQLEGIALAVDPGEHTFTFDTEGQSQVKRTFTIQQAQKDRRETITFGTTTTASSPARQWQPTRPDGWLGRKAGEECLSDDECRSQMCVPAPPSSDRFAYRVCAYPDVPQATRDVYQGLYGRFAPMFFVPLVGTADLHSIPGVVQVSASTTEGLGATIGVGYSFGVLSLELAAALFLSGSHPTYHVSAGVMGCKDGDVKFEGLSGFVGPGARIASRDSTLRFTASMALGTAIRSFSANRCGDASMASTGLNASAGYVDPALLLDGGILIGSTPGTKLFVGTLMWLDFPSKDVVVGPDTWSGLPSAFFTAPGRGYLLASGPQIFFGPTLGVQFGH